MNGYRIALDLRRPNYHKLRHNKRPRIPVTLIVGIVCKEAIILAGDSQTTDDSSKRTDSNKMVKVSFAGGFEVLVAQAGSVAMSGRAIEILQKMAAGEPVNDYRKPAEVMQAALGDLRQEVSRLHDWDRSQQTAANIFTDYEFHLMMAYFYDGKPHVYAIKSQLGVVEKCNNFAAIGCGSTVAEYIFSAFNTSDMKLAFGISTAIYIVEEVKKVDAFCGGPTRTATVSAEGVNIQEQERIDEVVHHLIEADAKMKSSWNAALLEMMDKLAAKWRE